jgi:starch-binding outer membrane protein, SusD/RagB family
MKNIKYLLVILFLSFATISCEDFNTDLDVINVEDPNSTQLGTENTASKLFQNWYTTVNNYASPSLAMATMSDMHTCSWGNAAMRDMSSEPRIAWNNAASYSNGPFTDNFFNAMHVVLADSNGILATLAGGATFSDNNMVSAVAKLGQALAVGSLAVNFDRVWLSDETGPLNGGQAVPFSEAITFALTKLNEAIAISNNNVFTVNGAWFNSSSMSNVAFAKLLNSFAARILVNSVRNSSQRDAIDWAAVKGYADKAITTDFTVIGDGWRTWYNDWALYSIYPGWGRIDMRVINLMDPSTISYWVSTNTVAAQSTSIDARLVTDFEYINGQAFIPSRGIYHYSSYRHARYDNYLYGGFEGPFPEILAAEITLYKVEAMLRTNNLAGAAALLNSATYARKSRGNLPDVAANAVDIAKALHYERSIEILTTGSGLAFYEMRRENKLQAGTPLHFPVPGKQLQAAKLDNYTFGGTTGVAGKDYSTGGWR